MFTSTIFLTAFAALSTALPASIDLTERAGGPASKPIPASCKITYPQTTIDSSNGFFTAESTKPALLYSAYYPSPSTNTTAMAQQCLQQCYGYGDSTQCKAAYWAENVEVPKGYYGSPGGTYNTACLFYTRALTYADFVVAPQGKGTTPFAANIQC
jgi:hypothetical protein